MNQLFERPLSTSNLWQPDFDRLWNVVSSGMDELGSLIPGQLVAELEAQLGRYHHSKYCVAFSTGFWALVASIALRSIPGRSEVIVPSLTYRRLADAVHWAGHIPVFADVESKRLSLDPRAVEQLITSQTALILGVHPIVNCCDVEGLIAVSKEHQVPVIFDAVESAHETFNSKRVGSFEVGEIFSLHASKLINGIEGGYVCTGDREFRDRLIEFRSDSTSERQKAVGGEGDSSKINGTLNDAHAAFALAGLEEIEANVAHNKQVYQTYCEELNALKGMRLVMFDETEQTSYKNIVAEVSSPFPLSRDDLITRLNQQDVLARKYYFPALHVKRYRYPVKIGNMTVTDEAMQKLINLPCGFRVSVAEVRSLCRLLRELAGNQKW